MKCEKDRTEKKFKKVRKQEVRKEEVRKEGEVQKGILWEESLRIRKVMCKSKFDFCKELNYRYANVGRGELKSYHEFYSKLVKP